MTAGFKPSALGKLLNVDAATVRRWGERYQAYLSPTASPTRGKARHFTHDDARVLMHVAALRDAGITPDDIDDRLRAMQADNWQDLPQLPVEWSLAGETMPVLDAATRAHDVAQIAVLQHELDTTRRELERANTRIADLERDLAGMAALAADKHVLEIEIEQQRGTARELEARLQAYAMAYSIGSSSGKPISAITLVGLVAVITILLVLLVAVAVVLIP